LIRRCSSPLSPIALRAALMRVVTAVTTAHIATDCGQPTGALPRVSREPGPDARATTLPGPIDRQDTGFSARKIASDGGRLCPCLRLQWLYGL
jgi:hypothetical protein